MLAESIDWKLNGLFRLSPKFFIGTPYPKKFLGMSLKYVKGSVSDSDLINFDEVQILQYTRGGAKVFGLGYMAIFFALKNKLLH